MNTEQQRVVRAALEYTLRMNALAQSHRTLTAFVMDIQRKAKAALAILNECEAQPVAADAQTAEKLFEDIWVYAVDLVDWPEPETKAECIRRIERFAQSREAAVLERAVAKVQERMAKTKAAMERAQDAGCVNVASHRQSDIETLEDAIHGIRALIPSTKTGDAK